MLTWTTPSNLGSRSEGTALSIQLTVTSDRGGTIRYGLVAGSLPTGVTLTSLGLLSGTPVGNTSYKFVIRAVNTVSGNTVISDRTFTILIVGHAPVVGTATTLPDQFDIIDYAYQVVATDVDSQDTLTYRISSGALPDALTLSNTGLISGFITKQLPNSFQFTVAVSDSTYTVYQSFILNIKNRVENAVITPLILNRNSNVGTFRVQDQFSYKIDGSLDGIAPTEGLTYTKTSGALPPGLTLRTNTGWIDGFLSASDYPTPVKSSYTFSVVANNIPTVGTPVSSAAKTFTIVIDPVTVSTGTTVWPVDTILGNLSLGAVSKFDVNPHNTTQIINFRIKAGTTGILPPNLILQPNGLITGRVSFLGTRSTVSSPTGTYTFTVEMVDVDNLVIAIKDFTIKTLYQYPYENIYLQTFPRPAQRTALFNLVTNVKIVPRSYVYRLGDPNFGLVTNFKMLAMAGLKATTGEYYVAAMIKNHSRKVAYISEFKLSVARDLTTSLPIYEVVYAVLKDTNDNAPSTIRLQKINRPKLKANNTEINVSYASLIRADQSSLINIYPNSFVNMRAAVSKVGFENTNVVPEWLTTLQDDGTTLGYSNVVPLVYTQVGRGAEVLANIVASGESFDTVPFDVDGYTWEDYVAPTNPNSPSANEISTSGITTKYLAFPRTGVSDYTGKPL
jgi:hypothetical protein